MSKSKPKQPEWQGELGLKPLNAKEFFSRLQKTEQPLFLDASYFTHTERALVSKLLQVAPTSPDLEGEINRLLKAECEHTIEFSNFLQTLPAQVHPNITTLISKYRADSSQNLENFYLQHPRVKRNERNIGRIKAAQSQIDREVINFSTRFNDEQGDYHTPASELFLGMIDAIVPHTTLPALDKVENELLAYTASILCDLQHHDEGIRPENPLQIVTSNADFIRLTHSLAHVTSTALEGDPFASNYGTELFKIAYQHPEGLFRTSNTALYEKPRPWEVDSKFILKAALKVHENL